MWFLHSALYCAPATYHPKYEARPSNSYADIFRTKKSKDKKGKVNSSVNIKGIKMVLALYTFNKRHLPTTKRNKKMTALSWYSETGTS